MKRFIALLLLPATLAGCLKVEPATSVSIADRIYTVDEFLAHPDLRLKVSTMCDNDPGQLGHDPNCINSRRANRIASAGSTAAMPRIIP